MFAGLDYGLNASLDLYFNLMYAEMDFAFRAANALVAQMAHLQSAARVQPRTYRLFYVAPASRVGSGDPQSHRDIPVAGAVAAADHHVFRDAQRSRSRPLC